MSASQDGKLIIWDSYTTNKVGATAARPRRPARPHRDSEHGAGGAPGSRLGLGAGPGGCSVWSWCRLAGGASPVSPGHLGSTLALPGAPRLLCRNEGGGSSLSSQFFETEPVGRPPPPSVNSLFRRVVKAVSRRRRPRGLSRTLASPAPGARHPPALLLGHDLRLRPLGELRGLRRPGQHLLHLQPEDPRGQRACEPRAGRAHRCVRPPLLGRQAGMFRRGNQGQAPSALTAGAPGTCVSVAPPAGAGGGLMAASHQPTPPPAHQRQLLASHGSPPSAGLSDLGAPRGACPGSCVLSGSVWFSGGGRGGLR